MHWHREAVYYIMMLGLSSASALERALHLDDLSLQLEWLQKDLERDRDSSLLAVPQTMSGEFFSLS